MSHPVTFTDEQLARWSSVPEIGDPETWGETPEEMAAYLKERFPAIRQCNVEIAAALTEQGIETADDASYWIGESGTHVREMWNAEDDVFLHRALDLESGEWGPLQATTVSEDRIVTRPAAQPVVTMTIKSVPVGSTVAAWIAWPEFYELLAEGDHGVAIEVISPDAVAPENTQPQWPVEVSRIAAGTDGNVYDEAIITLRPAAAVLATVSAGSTVHGWIMAGQITNLLQDQPARIETDYPAGLRPFGQSWRIEATRPEGSGAAVVRLTVAEGRRGL